MVTFLILLPVASVLIWLYWLCLPKQPSSGKRWRWFDSCLLVTLVVFAGYLVNKVMHTDYVNAGPIWQEVVAATSAYCVITIGLAIGLTFRRRAVRKTEHT